jgi:hypothetical protein
MINRRAFLLSGAALATAGTAATWSAGPAVADATVPSTTSPSPTSPTTSTAPPDPTASAHAGSPAPKADTDASDLFDLSVPAVSYLREKLLYNETIMQSFAFDDTHDSIYAIQLMQGGVQLPGESAPVSGADRSAHGDLCLTKLNLSGTVTGHMYLRGFGHGASIGVEPSGSGAYIWTEADANPDTGYGTGVGRFAFSNGAVLDSSDSAVQKIYVLPGSTSNRPAVDVRSGRLLVQYMLDEGDYRYRVLDLEKAGQGDVLPLYDIPRIGIDETETPQGLALLGDYVYQMTGTHYTDESGDNPPSGHGNTYLTAVHVPTSTVVQRSRTEAAYSLDYREPEGLAVTLGTSPARLCMGFASGVAGDRKYTIYYKPQS